MDKYCPKCKRETRHRKLKKAGFFTQCLVAGIAGLHGVGLDLREPDYECNNCGTETNT